MLFFKPDIIWRH